MKKINFSSLGSADNNLSFYEACEKGNVQTVESLLLQFPRDIESQSRDIDVNYNLGGYTPLHIACINKRFDVVKILLKDYGINPNLKSHHLISAFHYVCAQGYHEVIKDFLERPGLNVNELGKFGQNDMVSALTMACLNFYNKDYEKTLRLLLSSGRLSYENKKEAFYKTMWKGKNDALAILLEDRYLSSDNDLLQNALSLSEYNYPNPNAKAVLTKCLSALKTLPQSNADQKSWQAESVSNRSVMGHSMS
jgi:hypothetical protein